MLEDTIHHGERSNVIPFPRAHKQHLEIWHVLYVGQANDGMIKRTLVVRD